MVPPPIPLVRNPVCNQVQNPEMVSLLVGTPLGPGTFKLQIPAQPCPTWEPGKPKAEIPSKFP